ncbi:MAG: queuosine precursor transporter [Phycisphaerae bacterium]|nr:queuosine precursor transporter [Phycisphaerae bacterium]
MDSAPPPPAPPARDYKYYDLLLGGFVAVLLCSNLIGPGKLATVFGLTFGAGNIFFPVSYIFGDVLTEVYGYARTRRVIWAGFAAMVFAAIMSSVVVALPALDAPNNNEFQAALQKVFGNTWRIVVGSILAFLVGDFVNSYVLSKLKILTRGRYLWTRTIGSTILGQGVDTLIFYPIAFYNEWTNQQLFEALWFNWVFKVAIEIVMTPVTYLIVNAVKRAEGEDHYDYKTNYTPFSLDAD